MPTNIGSVDLSPRKESWLRVAYRVNGESRRVRVGKIIEGHFPRFLNIYVAEIDFAARLYGVSWETMYVLLDNESLPMPFTAEDIEWAKQQPPLVHREEIASGKLGVELDEKYFEEISAKLTTEAAIALELGFRAGLELVNPKPTVGDLSPWAFGYHLAQRYKEGAT